MGLFKDIDVESIGNGGTPNVLGVAVVGYGYWGPNLVRNFRQAGAEVRVCCDTRKERLEDALRTTPTLRVTADYSDVLADPSIDAVAIATPLRTHFYLAKQALESGRHVLIEKPMTFTSAEAEQLVELAERKSLRLMVDHTFLFTGAVRKIKQIHESGALGEILYIDSRRINLGLYREDVNVIWDLAPHDFSIIDYLINEEPEAISTISASHLRPGTEDFANITLFYSRNVTATIQVSWLAPVKTREMIVCGSEKMLRYDDVDPDEKIKIFDKGVELIESDEDVRKHLISYRYGDVWIPSTDQTEALYRLCSEFIDYIANGRRPLTDGEAGLRIVRMLESANQSIKNRGQEVLV